MSLSEEIKTMRKKALLSQDELASILHVSVGSINRWENGKTKPNLTAMKRIRAYCQDNQFPYDVLEAEWLKDKE